VFAPGFDGWPTEASSVAVVGGGISAGQIALRLIEEGHEVHLLARHPLRKSQFDSDPGWLGPKFMSKFARESCLDARRAMVAGARRSGSVPPDLLRALERAIERGDLGWHQSEVERLDGCPDQLSLTLNGGELLHVERVLLATGLVSRRPGGPLVDDLVEAAALPCASCGYPIVGTDLRWHSRIVVSGALAELELGPAARNIAGARRAGDRIVDSLRHIRR
jgi:glycine/D-amino acid oxidase-like deaminating enzyme